MTSRRRGALVATLALCLPLAATATVGASAPGGIVERATDTTIRPPLTPAQIAAFVPPTRGAFTFPAPYHTRAARLTVPEDCGGRDCVSYVGYSYWRRINNHAGSSTMLVVLGLARNAGGSGPTLFRYDKTTEAVTKLGPLFEPGSPFADSSAELWYWSAVGPSTLYVSSGGRLFRYDVLARTLETVFDVSARPDLLGANRTIFQAHSSDDDRVHSATLMDGTTYARLGCVTYREDTRTFAFFPASGTFKECHVDKSGRWLLMFDTTGGIGSNVVVDLQTGARSTVLDQRPGGILGHYDTGHGFVVAYDRWSSHPGTFRLWQFGAGPAGPYPWGPGRETYRSHSWQHQVPDHVSWGNARPASVTPIESQYVCGSGATTGVVHEGNEILCWPLDGSLTVLVVAPVMTDLNAPGGGTSAYDKFPKGNLDVTGEYFVWTANMGGPRLDAFIVRVPAQRLTERPSMPAAGHAESWRPDPRLAAAAVALVAIAIMLIATLARRGAQPGGSL